MNTQQIYSESSYESETWTPSSKSYPESWPENWPQWLKDWLDYVTRRWKWEQDCEKWTKELWESLINDSSYIQIPNGGSGGSIGLAKTNLFNPSPSNPPKASFPENLLFDCSPDTVYVDVFGRPVRAENGPRPSYDGSWFEITVDSNSPVMLKANYSYSHSGLDVKMDPELDKLFLFNEKPNKFKIKAVPKFKSGLQKGSIRLMDFSNRNSVGNIHLIYDPDFLSNIWGDSYSEWTTPYYDPSIQSTQALSDSWNLDITPHEIYVDICGRPFYADGQPMNSYQNGWTTIDIDSDDLNGNTVTLMGSYTHYDNDLNTMDLNMTPELNKDFLFNIVPNTFQIKANPTIPKQQGSIFLMHDNRSVGEIHLTHDPRLDSFNWWQLSNSGSYPATELFDPNIYATAPLPDNWGIDSIPDKIYLDANGKPIAVEGGLLPSYDGSWFEIPLLSDDLHGNTVALLGSYGYGTGGIEIEMVPPLNMAFSLNKVPSTIKIKAEVHDTAGETQVELAHPARFMYGEPSYEHNKFCKRIVFVHNPSYDSTSEWTPTDSYIPSTSEWTPTDSYIPSTSEWTPTDSYTPSTSEWTPLGPTTQYYDPSIRPTSSGHGSEIDFIPNTVYVNAYGKPVSANGNTAPTYDNGWCVIGIDSDTLYGNTVSLWGSYSDYNDFMELETSPTLEQDFLLNKVPNTVKIKAKPVIPDQDGYIALMGDMYGSVHFKHDPSHDDFSWWRRPYSGSYPKTQYFDPEINPTQRLSESWVIDTNLRAVQLDGDGIPNDAIGGAVPVYDESGWFKITLDSDTLYGNTAVLMAKTYSESYTNGISLETYPPLGTAFPINKVPNTIQVRTTINYEGDRIWLDLAHPAHFSGEGSYHDQQPYYKRIMFYNTPSSSLPEYSTSSYSVN